MTPNSLVCELESTTCDLLAAAGIDLDRAQKILERRAAVLGRIAKCEPDTFTTQDLAKLRDAIRNGEAALEKLALMRRSTAADWNRLKNLRSTIRQPDNHSVSFSG